MQEIMLKRFPSAIAIEYYCAIVRFELILIIGCQRTSYVNYFI